MITKSNSLWLCLMLPAAFALQMCAKSCQKFSFFPSSKSQRKQQLILVPKCLGFFLWFCSDEIILNIVYHAVGGNAAVCVCRLQPLCIKSLNKKEVIRVSAGAHHSIALTAQSQVRLSALKTYGVYFELLTVYLKKIK